MAAISTSSVPSACVSSDANDLISSARLQSHIAEHLKNLDSGAIDLVNSPPALLASLYSQYVTVPVPTAATVVTRPSYAALVAYYKSADAAEASAETAADAEATAQQSADEAEESSTEAKSKKASKPSIAHLIPTSQAAELIEHVNAYASLVMRRRLAWAFLDLVKAINVTVSLMTKLTKFIEEADSGIKTLHQDIAKICKSAGITISTDVSKPLTLPLLACDDAVSGDSVYYLSPDIEPTSITYKRVSLQPAKRKADNQSGGERKSKQKKETVADSDE